MANAELHACDDRPWRSRNSRRRAVRRAARGVPRVHGGARLPGGAGAGREDEAADELMRGAARAGEGRGALGAAPAARGGRHRPRLSRLRVPERGDRPQRLGRSSSSTARRRMPATARSSTCSAPTSRRSSSCGRSSRATTRSFFSMTEPEVSGADPTRLRTRAVLDGDEWVIDGHKWFSSRRRGSRLRDRDGGHRPGRRAAPADAPDPRAGRHARDRRSSRCRSSGHRGRGWSTHCEVTYDGRARAGGEPPRRARRRLPDRAEAARPGPHPPRHALARADAARVRPHVLATRSSARRSAARSPRSRPCRTGSPTRPPRSRPAG